MKPGRTPDKKNLKPLNVEYIWNGLVKAVIDIIILIIKKKMEFHILQPHQHLAEYYCVIINANATIYALQTS